MQAPHTTRPWHGVAFAFGAAMAAGIMVPVGKLAGAALNPVSFLAWMALIAGVTGGVVQVLRRQSFGLVNLDWQTMLYHGLAVTMALFCLWEGVARIHPAAAAFIGNSQVLFSIIIGRIMFQETFNKASVGASALILLGLMVMQWDASLADSGDPIGGMFVLAAALFFAIADMAMKRRAQAIAMFPFLAVRNIILAFVFYSFAAMGPGFKVPVSSQNWLQVIVAAIVGLLVSRLCFNLALRELAISKATLLFQIYPLVAIFVTVALGGEWPRPLQVAGGFFLTFGVMTLAVMKEKHLPQAPPVSD